MKQYFITQKKNLYKCNLHTHSTCSDGRVTPEELKKKYKEKGYSILCLSDHDIIVDHSGLNDKDFLFISGHEMEINESYAKVPNSHKTYHLNFYAPRADMVCSPVFSESRVWAPNSKQYITEEMKKTDIKFEYSVQDMNKAIKLANDAGFLVTLNHPVWSLQDYTDYIDLKGLWGIELFNTAVSFEGYYDSPKPMEDLLRAGKNVFPICADDAHFPDQVCVGHIVVNAEKLDYSTVFAALKAGDFYASTGAEIKELYIEDGKVTVTTGTARQICLLTSKRYARFKYEYGAPMDSAEFDISDFIKTEKDCDNDGYFRIEVTDLNGYKAYSRAYRISELK